MVDGDVKCYQIVHRRIVQENLHLSLSYGKPETSLFIFEIWRFGFPLSGLLFAAKQSPEKVGSG